MARRYGVAPALMAAACVALAAHSTLAQIGFPVGRSRSSVQTSRPSLIQTTVHLPMGGAVAEGVYRTKADLDAAIVAANPRRNPSSMEHSTYGVNWENQMVVVCPSVRGPGNQTSQVIESIEHKTGTQVIHIVVNQPGPDDVIAESESERLLQEAVAIPRSDDKFEFKTRTERALPAAFLMRETHGETKLRDHMTWLVNGDVSQMRVVVDSSGGVEIGVDEVSSNGKSTKFGRNAGTGSSAAVDALAGKARETGFMDLKDSYGKEVPDIDQRVRLIRVNVDGRKKEVLVRDDPNDPVPLSFEKMWKAFRDVKAQASLNGGSWGTSSSSASSSSGGGGAAGWSSGGGGFSVSGGASSSGFSSSGGSPPAPTH